MDVFVFAWDKTNDYLIRGEPEHLGTVQNIWNAWKKYMNEGKPKNLDYSGIFMHEAGHMFNLLQEAQSSACDDYELDPIEENQIGNNIMRNNGGAANALTPKQYSIIHDYLPKAPYTKYPACDITYSPIIIPTGVETYWIEKKKIYSEIEIPTGATLIVQCDLFTNQRITVRRGGKLIVEACKISSSCPEFWPGIYVEGSTKDHLNVIVNSLGGIQQADDPGIVILNNAHIINAVDGVITLKPEDPWNRSFWGGIIQASSASFIDNRRAVAFYPYRLKNKSSFDECTFRSLKGYAGITMWDVHDINITDCDFDHMGNGKSLFAPSYGAIGSTLSLTKITGDVGIVSIDASASIYDNCTFKNLTHAIDVKSTIDLNLSQSTFDIGKASLLNLPNLFEGNDTHIFSTGILGLEVWNNYFKTCNEGAFIQDNSRFKFHHNQFSDFRNGLFAYRTGNATNRITHNKWVSSKMESNGINVRRENKNLFFDQNCFDVKLFDLYIYTINGIKFADQGSREFPYINLFSHFVTRPDIRNQQAPAFNYWHPDPNLFQIPARLVPSCDLNSVCTPTKSNHFNMNSRLDREIDIDCILGILTPSDDLTDHSDDLGKYLSAKSKWQTLNELMDGGDKPALILGMQVNPNSQHLISSLMNYSPYLSEEIIDTLLQSDMDSINKHAILIVNKPFGANKFSLFSTWLTPPSALDLISYEYSPRDSARAELQSSEADWIEFGFNLIGRYTDELKFDSAQIIINEIPISDKRALWFSHKLRTEDSLEVVLWLDSLPMENISDQAFNLLGHIQLRLNSAIIDPTLSLEEDSLLQVFAQIDIPEKSYAQAILFILKESLYHYELPTDTINQSQALQKKDLPINHLKLTIAPQPVTNSLCYSITGLSRIQSISHEIFDVNGILRLKIKPIYSDQDCLDVGILEPGIYFIKSNTVSGPELINRFVKI